MQAGEDEESGMGREPDDDDDKGGLVAALRKVSSLTPAMARLLFWLAEYLAHLLACIGPNNQYTHVFSQRRRDPTQPQ